MSDESWNEVIRVVAYKAQESGTRITADPNVFLGVMKDNWELLCNHDACCAYLAEKDLAEKQAALAEAQAQADALAAEIAALGG
jgi:hypothetical protein